MLELVEVINVQYAFPVVSVLICALLVYAFGFKSVAPPPRFDFIEDTRKTATKKRKPAKKSTQNGHVSYSAVEPPSPPPAVRQPLHTKSTVTDKVLPTNVKQDNQKILQKPTSAERRAAEVQENAEDGEWVQLLSKKDRKNKRKDETEGSYAADYRGSPSPGLEEKIAKDATPKKKKDKKAAAVLAETEQQKVEEQKQQRSPKKADRNRVEEPEEEVQDVEVENQEQTNNDEVEEKAKKQKKKKKKQGEEVEKSGNEHEKAITTADEVGQTQLLKAEKKKPKMTEENQKKDQPKTEETKKNVSKSEETRKDSLKSQENKMNLGKSGEAKKKDLLISEEAQKIILPKPEEKKKTDLPRSEEKKKKDMTKSEEAKQKDIPKSDAVKKKDLIKSEDTKKKESSKIENYSPNTAQTKLDSDTYVPIQPAKKPANKPALEKTTTTDTLSVESGVANGKVAFDELADTVQENQKPQKKKKARRDQ